MSNRAGESLEPSPTFASFTERKAVEKHRRSIANCLSRITLLHKARILAMEKNTHQVYCSRRKWLTNGIGHNLRQPEFRLLRWSHIDEITVGWLCNRVVYLKISLNWWANPKIVKAYNLQSAARKRVWCVIRAVQITHSSDFCQILRKEKLLKNIEHLEQTWHTAQVVAL